MIKSINKFLICIIVTVLLYSAIITKMYFSSEEERIISDNKVCELTNKLNSASSKEIKYKNNKVKFDKEHGKDEDVKNYFSISVPSSIRMWLCTDSKGCL